MNQTYRHRFPSAAIGEIEAREPHGGKAAEALRNINHAETVMARHAASLRRRADEILDAIEAGSVVPDDMENALRSAYDYEHAITTRRVAYGVLALVLRPGELAALLEKYPPPPET